MTEFVVLIPARLDSSRLPGKALADIHGKPMVVRVAEQAAKSKAARVVVATDHPDIQTACQAHSVEVVLDKNRNAIYFSRAPIPYPRDAMRAEKRELPAETAVLRHIGIYAYRAGFLQRYAEMSVSPLETIESLEQLRVLWHGYPIAVETAKEAPAAGVDTQEDLDRVRAAFEVV